jgi:hypothetical protein
LFLSRFHFALLRRANLRFGQCKEARIEISNALNLSRAQPTYERQGSALPGTLATATA